MTADQLPVTGADGAVPFVFPEEFARYGLAATGSGEQAFTLERLHGLSLAPGRILRAGGIQTRGHDVHQLTGLRGEPARLLECTRPAGDEG